MLRLISEHGAGTWSACVLRCDACGDACCVISREIAQVWAGSRAGHPEACGASLLERLTGRCACYVSR